MLAAVDGGTPREEVAKTFSVSVPSIKRWLKRRRETGDVSPKPIPGRIPRKSQALKQWLPEHLKENSDLTLKEHCQAFEAHSSQNISEATMSRAIAALPGGGWPLKKVSASLRTRRGGEGPVAVAGFSLRGRAVGVRR